MQQKYKFTYSRLKIALIIAISFFSFFAKAQDTDSVRIAINNILAPLNKTLIPTGILAENSYPPRLGSWHTKHFLFFSFMCQKFLIGLLFVKVNSMCKKL